MKKTERQALIKQLLQDYVIETQEDLLRLLKSKNVKATQATISRDIREMNIVKGHQKNGKVRYMIYSQSNISPEKRLAEACGESVVKVEQVEFVVVLHTIFANADVVSALLDEVRYPEVVGTMAGVDTIITICKSVELAADFHDRIARFMKQ